MKKFLFLTACCFVVFNTNAQTYTSEQLKQKKEALINAGYNITDSIFNAFMANQTTMSLNEYLDYSTVKKLTTPKLDVVVSETDSATKIIDNAGLNDFVEPVKQVSINDLDAKANELKLKLFNKQFQLVSINQDRPNIESNIMITFARQDLAFVNNNGAKATLNWYSLPNRFLMSSATLDNETAGSFTAYPTINLLEDIHFIDFINGEMIMKGLYKNEILKFKEIK